MISFKNWSNLRLEMEGMSMPTYPWLLDFLAKPTVIRSPLLSHCGRSGVDGGLWGSRSHSCNRFMVKCYTNAYKGLSLFLFPVPSFVSLSFSRLFLRASPSPLLPSFFFVSASSSSLFLPCLREYRGMHRHFRASPRYRCCKSTRHRWDLWATVRILSLAKAQWTLRTVTMYHAKFLKIVDKHQCTNTASRYIKIKFGRDRCLIIITSFGRVRWTSETVRNVPKFFSQKSWSLSVSTSVYYCTIIETYF